MKPNQFQISQQNNIYQDILGEMAQEHNKYLTELVQSNSKKKQKRSKNNLKLQHKEIKKDQFKFDEIIESPILSDPYKCQSNQKFNSFDEQNQQSQSSVKQLNKQKLESVAYKQETQRHFKMKGNHNQLTNFETPREQSGLCIQTQQLPFVQFLDNFINKINKSTNNPNYNVKVQQQKRQIQKIKRKIEKYEKKFKQLQLANYLEIKQLKRKQQQLKINYEKLSQQMEIVTLELENERKQRSNLENVLTQFENKVNYLQKSKKNQKKYLTLYLYQQKIFKQSNLVQLFFTIILARFQKKKISISLLK